MPNWIERINAAAKAFRTGPAVVSEQLDSGWGSLGIGGDSGSKAPSDLLSTSVAVYACATLRAENLAGLPIKSYRHNAKGEREEVTSGKFVDLINRVNPFWTFSQLIEMTELTLATHEKGAFWVLERGEKGTGVPTEIWWCPSDKIQVVPHPVEYIKGFILDAGDGKKIPLLPGEVIWFRYPNPANEFKSLTPIAAARLSVELGQAGLASNKRLFDQGMQIGGVISPADKDARWSKESTEALEKMLAERFRGAKQAHKWAVLSQALNIQAVGINPKDAEFLGQMGWSLADVCRVYKVSPVLVQDLSHSTYSNFEQALKALWTLALKPEARRIQTAISEQLVPMFGGEVTEVEFDLTTVDVLQEGEDAKWTREQGQIQTGAITINEWREGRGLKPVPWGNVPMNQASQAPAEGVSEDAPVQDDLPPAKAAQKALALLREYRAESKAIEYGSDAHIAVMKRFERKASKHERRFKALVTELFEEQADAIVARLKAKKGIGTKAIEDLDDDFEAYWRGVFARRAQKELMRVVEDAGEDLWNEFSIAGSFDVNNPKVAEFVATRAQRFAEQVSETTWDALRNELVDAELEGEGIDAIAERVRQVMGDRIRSSAETIARTETIGALNGGALEAAKQSGVVKGKRWLSAFTATSRDAHSEAHGQLRDLDEDFEVGDGKGPAPGQMGVAGEDINCLCTMTWEV